MDVECLSISTTILPSPVVNHPARCCSLTGPVHTILEFCPIVIRTFCICDHYSVEDSLQDDDYLHFFPFLLVSSRDSLLYITIPLRCDLSWSMQLKLMLYILKTDGNGSEQGGESRSTRPSSYRLYDSTAPLLSRSLLTRSSRFPEQQGKRRDMAGAFRGVTTA